MQILPQNILNHLNARKPILMHALLWVEPRDRDTGQVEPVGFWTGSDNQTIMGRDYFGVGSVLGIEALTSAADMRESDWSFQLSSLHEQAVEAFRQYDGRLAPVECHIWYWDPVQNIALGDPVRRFRGTVMTVDLPTPPQGGESVARIQCVSDAWRLSRGLTLKRSQAALSARAPGDRGRIYNTISGMVQVAWGEKMLGGSKDAPEQRPSALWGPK